MPNLTAKELTALEEQLNAESVLVAKYKEMANQCPDAAFSETLDQIAEKHQIHYDTLYKFLIK